MTRPLKKILVVQPYGIGDLLFLTPVLRALRQISGVETVDLLLGSRTEAVIADNPHVGEFFLINKDIWHAQGRGKAFKDMKELTARLAPKKYDLLLDYSLRGEYGLWAQFFLGIPKRAGFNYKNRAFFHNIKFSIPEGFHKKHVAEFFADLARKAGVPVEDLSMQFFVSSKDGAEAASLLKDFPAGENYLAVSAGGGESWGKDAHFKRWKPAYFTELAEKLKQMHKISGVVILGSAGERELAEDFLKNSTGPVLNLCGKVSLGVSGALIEKSRLFLGNDGGLMHLARALKKPVVALFGPVDSAVYGPFPPSSSAAAVVKENLSCRPCYFKFRYNGACETRECLRDLTPDEVLAELKRKKFSLEACSKKK